MAFADPQVLTFPSPTGNLSFVLTDVQSGERSYKAASGSKRYTLRTQFTEKNGKIRAAVRLECADVIDDALQDDRREPVEYAVTASITYPASVDYTTSVHPMVAALADWVADPSASFGNASRLAAGEL